MLQSLLKWDIQQLSGALPSKITNQCTFYLDNLYLVVDNIKCNDLYALDLNDYKWRKLYNGIPFKAKFGAQFAMSHGKLYCYGGSIDSEGTMLLDDMLEIDVVTIKFRQIKNAPQGRIEHAMCVYRNSLLMLGGRTQKKVFNDCITYDPQRDKWLALECEPHFRFGHQLTVYEDTVIVTGGSDGLTILEDVWLLVDLRTWIRVDIKNPYPLFRHQATLAMKEYLVMFGGCSMDGKRYNDNFLALNLVQQRWVELPRVSRHPQPRVQHSMVALMHQDREYILLIGGLNYQELCILDFCKMAPLVDLQPTSLMSQRSHTVEGDEFLNDIPMEIHQQSDKGTSFLELGKYYEWKQEEAGGNLFTARTGHSVVQFQDQFILFGGSDDNTILNDTYSYSLQKKVWEQLICRGLPPSPRSGCKGIAYQNDIYYFGGYTSRKGEYFNDFYIFDVKQRFWRPLKSNKELQPRVDMSLVYCNSKIYIFGGSDGSNRFSDLHCYDTQQLTWIKMRPHGQIPSPRFGHTADVYKNQMYVFGGWNGYNTLDELYTYSFASNYWYLEKVRIKPPSRYRHASTLIGCSIFIFGGVDTNQTRFDDLYEFNCETKEWKFIETAGNTPSARTFHQFNTYETKLYLIGGNDGVKKNNDMYSIQVFDNRFSDFSSVMEFEIQPSSGQYQFGLINLLKTQVQELDQRLKEEQEFILCQLCRNKDINSVFLECGHRFCCYDCSNKLETCKICLKKPLRIIKIYVV